MAETNICPNPNCDFNSDTAFDECPKCGIVVDKFMRTQRIRDKEKELEKVEGKLKEAEQGVKEYEKRSSRRMWRKRKAILIAVAVVLIGWFGYTFLPSVPSEIKDQDESSVHDRDNVVEAPTDRQPKENDFKSPTFKNEPTGFRQITWGTDISNCPDMVFIDEAWDNYRVYGRIRDEKKIGPVRLLNIAYWFYKNKLTAVEIHLKEDYNIAQLLTLLEGKYGKETATEKGHRPLSGAYIWRGDKVEITYSVNLDDETGSLFYAFTPLFNLAMEDRLKTKGDEF
jgi:hypothetical protein